MVSCCAGCGCGNFPLRNWYCQRVLRDSLVAVVLAGVQRVAELYCVSTVLFLGLVLSLSLCLEVHHGTLLVWLMLCYAMTPSFCCFAECTETPRPARRMCRLHQCNVLQIVSGGVFTPAQALQHCMHCQSLATAKCQAAPEADMHACRVSGG
jgi:hypothetical protein